MDSRTLSTKRRDVFFSNLLLLGLNENFMKKKYNVNFHKDMFCLPNKKGFEVVSHFLFTKLNEISDEDYSISWPLLDKEHEREFKKTCFTYMLRISQSSSIRFPRIVQSIFSSPGGDRFYILYLALSSHIIHRHIEKSKNMHLLQRCSASQQSFKDLAEVLKLSTITETENFQETQTVALEHHQNSIKCAKDFELCYRNIKKSITSKDALYKEKTQLLTSIYSQFEGSSINLETIISKITARCEQVKKSWKLLEDYQMQENRLWNILRSDLEDGGTSYSLDGTKFSIPVPKVLLKHCSSEALEDITHKQNNDTQLSVISYIKLITVCLDFYAKSLKKAGSPQLHLAVPKEKDLSDAQETLNAVMLLNKKIVLEAIPNMKKTCTSLQQELISEQKFETSENISSKFPPLSPKLDFSEESVQNRFQMTNTGRTLLSPPPKSNETAPFRSRTTGECDQPMSQSKPEDVFDFDDLDIDPPNYSIHHVTRRKSSNSSIRYTTNLMTIDESAEDKPVQCVPEQKQTASYVDASTFEDVFYTPTTTKKKSRRRKISEFKMRESWLKEEALSNISPTILVDASPS